ncbi:DUF4395 domain-containing protein [Rhodoluna lacicola]|mgnify:CR=1 FL=1|jgi:hypothetical protein|uniref:DUF4395 domain-containing protein n=1 Tax=Rhodoluna lacicola TaxID=529884 RepID=A0A060JEV2_9MICO|nr:DUF4395 domain-containing protein [Rhodoluna lacicola]AIC47285.1 hypothetical protein Rhola_00004660 [Rhodoluna lacicola]BDS50182.1 hypothetical protein RKACHI23_04440 [Rhodoluna lacicola]
MSTSNNTPAGIDPRGPRFGATITSVLLLITVFLALDAATLGAAFGLLVLVTVSFAIGAFLGNSKHPYGLIFKKLIRPRLAAPKELEDPRPPQFAQLVGLLVAGTGVVLYIAGAQGALVFAAGAAFVAAFLNAAFAFCLGCQMYVGLQRIGLIKKH